MACEIVLALQTAVTRQFNVFDPVVLTVGRFAAGTKDNIIPDDAVIEATLRTFSPRAAPRRTRSSPQVAEQRRRRRTA